MTDAQIENKFKLAVDYITNNSGKLSNIKNEEQLYLYCNYKQATIGDCNTKAPPFYDYIGKSKWNSWNSLKGVEKIVAMNSYISLVNALSPGWDSNIKVERATQSVFLNDEEFKELEKKEKEEKEELKKLEEENGGEIEKPKSKWMGPVLSKFSLVDDETLEKLEKNIKQDLGYWVSVNDIERVKKEIENDKNIINEVDEDGRTALIWACDRGYFEIAQLLIGNGSNVNVQDGEGMTPLHYAVVCDQFEICKLLLSQPSIDKLIKDNSDSTPSDFIDSSTSENIKSLFK
ncbi:hypothetical protein ACTFIY_001325 [Dictyostelium cf. discoideum]